MQLVAQCNECLAWRVIVGGGSVVPDDWSCSYDPSAPQPCKQRQDQDRFLPPVSHLKHDICALLPNLHATLWER